MPSALDYPTELAALFHETWRRNALAYGQTVSDRLFKEMPADYRSALVKTMSDLIRDGVVIPNWWR